MKANVMAYIGVILIILNVAIMCNITAKSSYSDSVRQSLDESMERTMYLLQTDSNLHMDITIPSEKNGLYGTVTLNNASDLGDFKTEFIKMFSKNLSPKVTDLTINFFGADEKKGLLSVEIIAKFRYMDNQHEGIVKSYKTIIINREIKPVTDD